MLAFYLLVMSGLELQHSYKMLKLEYKKLTVATKFVRLFYLEFCKISNLPWLLLVHSSG